MYQVAVLDYLSPEGYAFFRESGYELHSGTGADAVTVRSTHLDTDRYPHLIAVARRGIGVNNITLQKAEARGIGVFNTPGANANAVAELVMAMMVVGARNVHRALEWTNMLELQHATDDAVFAAEVEKGKGHFKGFELTGRTLGIIGLGAIGANVARKAACFGMHVIGYDPHHPEPPLDARDRRHDVSVLLREADVVSIHIPLSDETRHLINEETIEYLAPGAMLLNYARGPIVEEGALLAHLERDPSALYVCDFPTPRLAAAGWSVICTPHIGACTDEAEENCSVMAGLDLHEYLTFGVVRNCVTLPAMSVYPGPEVVTRLCIPHRNVRGVLAAITGACDAEGLNVAVQCPTSRTVGYAVVDLTEEIDDDLLRVLADIPNVYRVRRLRFPQ